MIAPFANKIFLSSTVKVAVLTVTVLPCTSKSPDTTKLLTVTLLPLNAAIVLSGVKYKLDPSFNADVVKLSILLTVPIRHTLPMVQ